MQAHMATPVKLWLQITETCNQNCIWCYGDCDAQQGPDELSKQEWLDFIDYLVEQNVLQIYIEGGEPFHRPDFLDILRYACPRLLTWVRTNATLITPELARELKEIGVGAIVADLMAAKEETHDYLAGMAGSYRRTVAGIQNVVAAGIPTIMSIVLNRINKDEVQEYVELAKELGVSRVGLLRLYPIGRSRARWDELSLSLEEMMSVIHGIDVPEGVHLMQSWHPQDGNCCWENAGVTAFGRSVGCPYLRELVDYGNIRETSFLDTWRHPLYEQLRSGHVDSHCEGCHTNEGTKGGCRASAYMFTGRWDAPDPYCTETNKGVDLRVLPSWLAQEEEQPSHSSDGRVARPDGVRA